VADGPPLDAGRVIRGVTALSSIQVNIGRTIVTYREIAFLCACGLTLTTVGAAQGFIYQIDDGNAEFRLGTVSMPSAFSWLNSFQVEPGAETLTSIEIALAQSIDEPSRPVTVYLWTDPTNDGDPSDAVVVRNISTVTTHEIVFETFPIDPLTLPTGSWFYAGALYVADEDPVLFPAAVDATEPFFAGRSFTITWGAGAVPDPNNLAAGAILAETAGNYLIRVIAVPEPSMMIAGVACLALGSCLRQRFHAVGRFAVTRRGGASRGHGV
jgi:hypothetical protein